MANVIVSDKSSKSKQLEDRLFVAFQQLPLKSQQITVEMIELRASGYAHMNKRKLESI